MLPHAYFITMKKLPSTLFLRLSVAAATLLVPIASAAVVLKVPPKMVSQSVAAKTGSLSPSQTFKALASHYYLAGNVLANALNPDASTRLKLYAVTVSEDSGGQAVFKPMSLKNTSNLDAALAAAVGGQIGVNMLAMTTGRFIEPAPPSSLKFLQALAEKMSRSGMGDPQEILERAFSRSGRVMQTKALTLHSIAIDLAAKGRLTGPEVDAIVRLRP